MAHRQEEKEARRQERLAREQSEAAAAARKRRLQMAFGGLLGLAALAAVVVLALGALGGDDGDGGASANGTPTAAPKLPTLPQQQEADWQKAAKAADCELINPPYEGAGHEEKDFSKADYKTNPPTSGSHFPDWADDAEYAPGETPPLGQLVHTLEHGRINVQYKPGTSEEVVNQLRAFLKEQNDGYHLLLYENPTDMSYEVAATAWTHILGCEKWTPEAIDALRTFRQRYIDKGPERVP